MSLSAVGQSYGLTSLIKSHQPAEFTTFDVAFIVFG